MRVKDLPSIGRCALLRAGSWPDRTTVEVRIVGISKKLCKVELIWIPKAYLFPATLRSEFPQWVKTRKLRLIDEPARS
jgi:hypothetical protein